MFPKPLSEAVHKGLAYLVNQQHADGGWSQGGGWRTEKDGKRVEGPNVQDPADVANTCMATLALLRAGHTPQDGDHAAHVTRGLDYVIGHVERADAESPYVTDVRGTQVQTKIGPCADTFLATLVLAEARGQMPDEQGESRLSAALDKAIAKMERNQQADGSWAMNGWAPVVGQSLASAALGRARQRGARVSDESLQRTEKHARSHYDARSKSYRMDGSAGVKLYSQASHLSASSGSLYNLKLSEAELRRTVESETATPAARAKAAEVLKDIADGEVMLNESLSNAYADFRDPGFIQGFGSNGGEEFLSHLNISETLARKGGEEWERWDKRMTENLERIQNADGSWAGHHCITGRTFCTAAALLVLMADRVPMPEPVAV